MYPNRAVRIFPCLMCWTPEVKCPNYVFLKRSICVDCERMSRQYGENEQIASHVHETLVRYLLDKYSERDGITYEKINAYIESAKEVNVDNLLTVALDYIFRNFSELYHAVCDAVEIARDRGPIQWTPDNLAERLERVKAEQEWDQKGRFLDER
ncbi:hypothetical protein NW752_009717 [Fusarium irregulare]|uniref:Uncharacterized protein n=1 Tax=Fusarium irregulare TaxID=2494466 RepID=A0A9W8PXB9_9HYPO|nr:hypothetical protein NW752_009717 [Fusarium irregulare]KAJ4021073.1 hypothetical protein NW766_002575 [Fusarium irregulare]